MTNKLGSRWFWSSLVATALLIAPALVSAQTPPSPAPGDPQQVGPPGPVPPQAPAPTTFPAKGPAPTQILLTPDTYLRFGFQGQAWINYQQALSDAGNYSLDLYLRRARFFAAAQFFGDLTVFVLFDTPNLGKAVQTGTGDTATVSKGFTPAIVQDMWGEIKLIGDELILTAGLMVVPFSHNGLQSTSSYLGLDVSNTAAVLAGTATSVLRDTGFQLKGYEMDDHLVFRLFVGSGLRQAAHDDDPVAHNAPRITGHVQYAILEPDVKGYVFQGMTYGRKKMLNLSAGFDVQKGDDVGTTTTNAYWAVSAAVSGNWPLSGESSPKGGDEIAYLAEFYHYDGGVPDATPPGTGAPTFAIPPQNDFDVEASYYNKELKLGVFGKFEMRKVSDGQSAAVKAAQNNLWIAGGIKYYLRESFCNFTLFYQRTQFSDAAAGAPDGTNQFVLQLQVYVF